MKKNMMVSFEWYELYRAIEEWYPLLDPSFLMQLEKEDCKNIFSDTIEIPLFHERFQNLRLLGKIMSDTFHWDFLEIIESSWRDTQKLLDVIVTTFPFFWDTAKYKWHVIPFYKRDQLLVADCIRAYESERGGIYGKTFPDCVCWL